jgi:LysM repeat protein
MHMTSQCFKSLAGLVCAVLLLAGAFPPARARALVTSPQAILDTVNALRASRGLQPYIADAGIMAYAQEHSEYQARIHQSMHEHSDGTFPPDWGLVENVAGGDIGWITPEDAVYEIWRDAGHMKTMIGYSSGAAGVGVADDGTTEYYTLDVRPGQTTTPTRPGKTTPVSQTATSLIPILPLVTMTPRTDGCTVHVVGNGQTLWAIAIAYGVKINDIRALNGMAPDSTTIYIGQKLLVRCETVTPTSQPTSTASHPTETPRPAENTGTPTLTLEPAVPGATAVTQVGANIPAALPGPPQVLVVGLLVLAGGTLLVVLTFALVRRR